MTITPQNMVVGMALKSSAASLILETDTVGENLLITSKLKGFQSNNISIEIIVNNDNGPPTCTLIGTDIIFRIPDIDIFEASGPFYYDGEPVATFAGLWYSGQLNERNSWATDGQIVTWPLDRDGEFMLYADSAWHMIRRESGVNVMHWQSNSDVTDIYQIPRSVYSEGNPNGWQGIAPLCTGYVDAHYGVDMTQSQYLNLIVEGNPDFDIAGNELVGNMILITIPVGQTGTGKFITTTKQRLQGGK